MAEDLGDVHRAGHGVARPSTGPRAPPNFGAIVPPSLVDAAKAWRRRLFDAGFAGVSWPEEYGGRGLSVDHGAALDQRLRRRRACRRS